MGATSEIRKYLCSPKFRDELVRQYKSFEILSEAGLRTAVANLLRARITAIGNLAKGYRVVCEPHLAEANVVPDVLVWKNKHPRIWIELKDTKYFDSAKAGNDWQKLQKYCKQSSSLKAGYLIYVARFNKGELGIKRSNQTRRYWPIVIALDKDIPDMLRWEVEYKRRAHYKLLEQKAKVSVRNYIREEPLATGH